MIIKSGEVATGAGRRVVEYCQELRGNIEVELVFGSSEALLMADKFAELAGHKNGLLHVTISPDTELTPDQLRRTLHEINVEYGFEPDEPSMLTRHLSRRGDGRVINHYHLVRPAADDDGKVYSRFRSKMKDEAVSRYLEIEFDHRITPGKHTEFAQKRMRERGHNAYADKLANTLGQRPTADFGSKANERAKRLHFDLKSYRYELRQVSTLPREQQPLGFAKLINRYKGVQIEQGERRSRLNVISENGELLHNSNRILKLKVDEVGPFVASAQEYLNETYTPKPDHGPEHSGIAGHYHHQPGAIASNEQYDSGPPKCSNIDPAQGGPLDYQIKELAQAAVDEQHATNRYISNRGMDSTICDIEPLPDLDDPHLMQKLSRMLKKSQGGLQGVAAPDFQPQPVAKLRS